MEAIIALLLVISTLTACAGTAPASTQTSEEQIPLEENAVLSQAAPQVLTYQVELTTYEETALADDGTELATCCFEYPVMTVLRADGTPLEEPQNTAEEQALAVTEAFNDQFGSDTEEEFREMTAIAQEDLEYYKSSGLEWTTAYSMDMSCTVYQTEQMVSIAAEYVSFTGGAHPNSVLLSWNFDLVTGQFFAAEVVAADGPAFSAAVQEELVRQSQETAAQYDMAAEDYFWADYEEILANWSSYAVSFDETGMVVAFSPYELAAYAAGSQVFHLTYEQLMPYLSTHGMELLGLETDGESGS